MYKSFKQISVLKCITNDALRLSPRKSHYVQILRKNSGLKEKKIAEPLININDELSYTSFLQHRQEQAQRSFVVKIPNPEVYPDLMKLFRSFGKVKNIFPYKQKTLHYILVEMESEDELINFMEKRLRIHQNSSYQNHFLVLNSNFRLNTDEADSNNSKKNKSNSEKFIETKKIFSKKEFDKVLNGKHESLSDFIMGCYEALKIHDLEIRQKFLICRQIEVLCSGFLPNAVAYPFGSSITGFGFNNSDLDISVVPHIKNNDKLFLQEDYLSLPREKVLVHLVCLLHIMKCFMPGSNNFYFVKHARVPIIKYNNLFGNVECDLSLYNLHGAAMSNILYTIGTLDCRIKALVIFIKLWANKVGMVLKSPSATISNFSLTLLVIFYLQQIKIIPPWNVFPSKERQLAFEDSDLSQLNSFLAKHNTRSKCETSVGEMLKLFFEYYDNFDFAKWGISVKTGEPIKKKIEYPLHIENPILPNENVSKNVNSSSVLSIKHIISDVVKVLSVENDKNKFESLFKLTYGQPNMISISNILKLQKL